nr:immunoglobulin light chain junction region [Macaca mulatta]
CVQGTQWPRTF